ncbi:MAG: hypothetical protein K8L91_30920 [Anaerolineae bacterium]|nr:hypothetical protein [Anaerolineae bacterium]
MSNYVSQKTKFFEEISEQFKRRGWKITPNSPTNLALSGYTLEGCGIWALILMPFVAFLGIIAFPINYLLITTTLKKVHAQLYLNEFGEIELTGNIGKRCVDRTILGKPQIPRILMLSKEALIAFLLLGSLPTTFLEIGILLNAIQ